MVYKASHSQNSEEHLDLKVESLIEHLDLKVESLISFFTLVLHWSEVGQMRMIKHCIRPDY